MKRWLIVLAFAASFAQAFSFDDVDMNKMVSGGTKLTKATVGLSDAQEIKIGREVGAYLAARYGMLNDEAKTRYVSRVGNLVARHSSRTDIPYHFGILKSDEINAWAAPGGYIFVTAGLLKFLENEAELAGALGHEIAHVQQRHIANAMRKADLFGAGQDFASAASIASDQYTALTNFSIDFINHGFSREEELEADKLGTALAAETGYDASAYSAAIARLGTLGEVSSLRQWNRTHPVSAQRVQAIDKTIHSKKFSGGQTLAERFSTSLKFR